MKVVAWLVGWLVGTNKEPKHTPINFIMAMVATHATHAIARTKYTGERARESATKYGPKGPGGGCAPTTHTIRWW
jgi:hypothetical protein